jgi:hypothetical protein
MQKNYELWCFLKKKEKSVLILPMQKILFTIQQPPKISLIWLYQFLKMKKTYIYGLYIKIYNFTKMDDALSILIGRSYSCVCIYSYNSVRSRKLQHMLIPSQFWNSGDELTVITIGANGFASFGCSIGIGG